MSMACGYVRRMAGTRPSSGRLSGCYGIFLVLTFD